MDYYLGKHMPLVREKSGPACKGVAVDQDLAARTFPHALSRRLTAMIFSRCLDSLVVLCLGLSMAVPHAVAFAQSSQCHPDTQACMTACVNAGETAAPGLDCANSCFKVAEEQGGQFCFTRYFPPKTRIDQDILRREVVACDERMCKPAWNRELNACRMFKYDTPQFFSCHEDAFRRTDACIRQNCIPQARQKATIPLE